VSEASRAERVREIFAPYHARIDVELDQRRQAGRSTVLIALHSFTPVFKGAARQWHAGVMYNRDPRFARHLLALLQKEPGLVVGDQQPYVVSDTSDYTIPMHGERRGLPHVLIEIRQDLIAAESGQRTWALILARLLPEAYAAFSTAAGLSEQKTG
jgi:predicted N-formylglutamate amidohydrolase